MSSGANPVTFPLSVATYMLSVRKTYMNKLITHKKEDFMDWSKLRYFAFLSSLAFLALFPGYGGAVGFLGFLGFLGFSAPAKRKV
jgi:hypothetical protein